MSVSAESEAVLEFWLGPLDADGMASEERRAAWWRKSPAFDEECRRRFAPLHASILGGEREGWLDQARSCLAYVVVLDQLGRNMFRDAGEMFAGDARALAAAERGIREHDAALAFHERYFLYMPFMHAEDRDTQARCEALFERHVERASNARQREAAQQALRFARKHRVIVERFGRFPHRNALLSRESSAEELEFLKQPGSSF